MEVSVETLAKAVAETLVAEEVLGLPQVLAVLVRETPYKYKITAVNLDSLFKER